jgi:prolipoprotein diacylglyceryltransferase
VPLAGCEGKEHCNYLPMPVFPTPFYETMICLLMFLILILIQNKLSLPGTLFSIYLIMNGLERFFIEKIRVNTKYQDLPFQPTQAEIISVGLILTAIFLLYFFKIKKGVSHKL